MFYAHSATKHRTFKTLKRLSARTDRSDVRLGIPRFMLCGDEITCINRRLCL